MAGEYVRRDALFTFGKECIGYRYFWGLKNIFNNRKIRDKCWLILELKSMHSRVYGSVGVDTRTFELRPDAEDENTATTTGATWVCHTILTLNCMLLQFCKCSIIRITRKCLAMLDRLMKCISIIIVCATSLQEYV
jgi:hypothetical protein